MGRGWKRAGFAVYRASSLRKHDVKICHLETEGLAALNDAETRFIGRFRYFAFCEKPENLIGRAGIYWNSSSVPLQMVHSELSNQTVQTLGEAKCDLSRAEDATISSGRRAAARAFDTWPRDTFMAFASSACVRHSPALVIRLR